MDAAQRWGLPANFAPVRYAISDEVKAAVAPLLNGEPVVVTLANEGDTVALVATPTRLFAIKTGELGAGAGGAQVREFPWEGVTNLVYAPVTHNARFVVHYKTTDGRRVEVGRRAALAKSANQSYTPFEIAAAEEVHSALHALWQWNTRPAAE